MTVGVGVGKVRGAVIRRIVFLLLSVWWGAALAYALQPGDTEAEVLATLGKPNAMRKIEGGAIWRYTNGTVVRIMGGVVKEIDGPGANTAIKGTVAPAVPVVEPPAAKAGPSKPVVPATVTTTPATSKPWMGAGRPVSDQEVEKILGTMYSRQRGMEVGSFNIGYSDHTQTESLGGIVQTISAPGADKVVRAIREGVMPKSQPAASAPAQKATAEMKTEVAVPVVVEAPSMLKKVGRIFGYGLIIVGALTVMVCKVLTIVAAFRETVWWGLACLFVPVFTLIYLLTRWADMKKIALSEYLGGIPVMFIGIYLTS